MSAPEADVPVTADAAGRATFAVRVIPRAGRTSVSGVRAGALLVRLGAPPVEGAANDALVDYLARLFDCARRQVSITAGDRSRDKRVALALDPAAVASRLAEIIAAGR